MPTLDGSYNLLLVALSFVVSVFGSYTALQLVRQSAQPEDMNERSDQLFWVGSAAVAMGGGGIWSMHFIGMVAFNLGTPVTYDLGMTIVSLLIAIAATGVGFFLVAQNPMENRRVALSGTFMGVGIAGMHYTGMAAMRMQATLSYDAILVIASLAIAIVASSAALWLAFHVREAWRRATGALVMGAAVCGMHYTAMAAANFAAGTGPEGYRPAMLGGTGLAYVVFLLSILLLSIQIGLGVALRGEEAEALAEL